MPWIKRRSQLPPPPVRNIGGFWDWWIAEGASATDAAYEAETLGTWAATLSKHILAIDADLEWELGPGKESKHVLVVTAAGDPALRATARRWRRAAPAPSATWAYSDTRLPTVGLDWTLDFAGHQVDAESVLVDARVDPAHATVDASVYHPVFPAMTQDQRDQVNYLLLDDALGEEAVETWIGAVSSTANRPPAGLDLVELQLLVRDLAKDSTDDDGELHWVVLRGTNKAGREVLALAQKALRPMTAPHLDTHVSVELPFLDPLPTGMPDEAALVRLRAMEDHLEARLEGNGSTVAHETCDGVRLLHLYVDGTTPAVEQVRAAVTSWTDGVPSVQHEQDPRWREVQHLTG